MRYFTLIPGILLLQACSWLSPAKEDMVLPGSSKQGPITVGELEKEIQDLADRYAMGVAEACDRVSRLHPDPRTQRSMLFLKLRNATSTYDAVTSGDALEGLLDLVTLIELQNIVWVDEKRVDRLPASEGSEHLRVMLGKGRTQAWELAARALTKDQLKKVRSVIPDWRRRNPEVQWVSFVRFSSGTGSASFSLLNELRSELGGILNPFGGTTRSVDETREVAAKALYFSKRLPMLLDWEAQATAGSIAEIAQVGRLEEHASSLSRTAAALPEEARSLLRMAILGLAVLMGLGFAFVLVYRRLSLGWQRKVQKPPTRIITSA